VVRQNKTNFHQEGGVAEETRSGIVRVSNGC
jgi:hypothetical protein